MEENKIEETVEEKKETPKKKKSNSFIIGLFVCIAIVVVGILIGSSFLIGKKEVEEPTTKKMKKKANEYYSDYRISGNSLDAFDFAFLQLENSKKNMVYSPLSIKYALEMLAAGTDGDSKAQIEAILGDYSAKSYPNTEHMSFANAVFVRNTFQNNFKESYINDMKSSFGAEVFFDEFKNASTINEWVGNKTFQLIRNLVRDDIVQDSNFFLVNALAIDMQWNNLLQCASGSSLDCFNYRVSYQHEAYGTGIPTITDENYPDMTFNNQDSIKSVEVGASFNRYNIVRELGEANIRKTVGDAYREWLESDEAKSQEEAALKYGYDSGIEHDVDKYLDQYIAELDSNYKQADISSEFSLYVDDDVKVFAKDLQTYNDMTLQYVAVMPQNVSLEQYIKDITPEELTKTINQLKSLRIENFKDGVVTKITGKIPLFQYEYELDLMKDLQLLGVEDVFDLTKADLSNMLEKSDQCITSASHKATIDFSNEGIKAAAATAMGGAGAAHGGFEYLYDVPVEIIDITFDQPFLYVIRDKDTGEVWFTGAVYEPTVQ